MPTDEELDEMAQKLYGCNFADWVGKANIMQLAIAAKHAKAACDLAEDSANYMARIVM